MVHLKNKIQCHVGVFALETRVDGRKMPIVAYIYQTQMLFVSSNKVLIWVFCKLCVQGCEFTKSLDIHVNVATNDTFPSSFSMLFLFRRIIS